MTVPPPRTADAARAARGEAGLRLALLARRARGRRAVRARDPASRRSTRCRAPRRRSTTCTSPRGSRRTSRSAHGADVGRLSLAARRARRPARRSERRGGAGVSHRRADTGTIWAQLIWGAWWVWWDMRLTLTLFLWFVVAAYLVMRGAIEDDRHARALLGGARRARRAADSVHPSERLSVSGAHCIRCRSCCSRASRRCRREMLVTFLLELRRVHAAVRSRSFARATGSACCAISVKARDRRRRRMIDIDSAYMTRGVHRRDA